MCVEGLFLHCQLCGLSGVLIRGESSAWLGTQGLPVKNKVPVRIRLLPWPGFVFSESLPKKATARAAQLHQLSPLCMHTCTRPWLRWTVSSVHICTHLMCICTSLHTYLPICMCIYAHKQVCMRKLTHALTHHHIHIPTLLNTHIQTKRHTLRYTHTHVQCTLLL